MKYFFVLLVVLLLGSCTISPKREKPEPLDSNVELVTPDTCLVRIDGSIFYITTKDNKLMYKAVQHDPDYLPILVVPFALLVVATILFVMIGLVWLIQQ
jgi:hypothetical protein